VLDAVAVVARLERDLAKDRADPQGGDAEPPEVAEFAPQPFQRAALPATAVAEPRIVLSSARVFGRVQGRGSGSHRVTFRVPIAAALVPVRETVQEQKIENLILPGGWRRGERPPGQGTEVNIQEALLNLVGHVSLSLEPNISSSPAAVRSATTKAWSR